MRWGCCGRWRRSRPGPTIGKRPQRRRRKSSHPPKPPASTTNASTTSPTKTIVRPPVPLAYLGLATLIERWMSSIRSLPKRVRPNPASGDARIHWPRAPGGPTLQRSESDPAKVSWVTDSRLQRYAELVARFAANVGEGQIVVVNALVEHAPLVRAVTRAAYQAGARWVGTRYSDAHVRRALIELAPEDSLSWTPPWALTELETLAKEDGALISITGDAEPNLLADLDGGRVGRARPL